MAEEQLKIADLLSELAPGFGVEGPLGGQFLTFDGDFLWSFNGEIGCMVSRPDDMPSLSGSVDGRRLVHFTSRAPTDTIKFHLEEDKEGAQWLKVKSGRASIKLKWLPAQEQPPYEMPKRWKNAPENFATAIWSASLSCASHITRPQMTCVHVLPEFVESSDGFRALRYDLNGDLGNIDVMVPRNVAQLLGSTGVKKIWPQKESVWFETSKGTRIFCSPMGGEFPRLDSVFDPAEEGSQKFTLPFEIELKEGVAKLEDALDRARVFEAEEGEPRITLTISNNKMKIISKDAIGEYEERLSLREAPDLSIRIHAQHLLDLVKQGKEVECELWSDRMLMRAGPWEFISAIEAPTQ